MWKDFSYVVILIRDQHKEISMKICGEGKFLMRLQLMQKTLWQKSVFLFLEEKGVYMLEYLSEREEKE